MTEAEYRALWPVGFRECGVCPLPKPGACDFPCTCNMTEEALADFAAELDAYTR